jgi:hypothetical protein
VTRARRERPYKRARRADMDSKEPVLKYVAARYHKKWDDKV